MRYNLDGEIDERDKEALELQKRYKKTESEIYAILNRIVRKDPDQLDIDEKKWLQARASYLTAGQRETFKNVLKEDLSGKVVPLIDLSREKLLEKALELGIEEPEKLPNKKSIVEAIKAVE